MNYLISMIMPVYNGEKFLKQSINSLIKQTIGFENIELIVVDDCSSDNTNKIMTEYSNNYENIKYYRLKKNSGTGGKPRNIGIQHATSDYIMFIDSDDTYEKSACETLFNTIENEDLDMVMGNIVEVRKDYNYQFDYFKKCESELIVRDFLKNPEICLEIFLFGTMYSKIYKKKIITENNIVCLEKALMQDHFFVQDYCLNSKNIGFLHKYNAYYYNKLNTESVTKEVSAKKVIEILNYLETVDDFINKYKTRIEERGGNIQNIQNICLGEILRLFYGFIAITKADDRTKLDILKRCFIMESKWSAKEVKVKNWAKLMNILVMKKMFKIALIYSKFAGFSYRLFSENKYFLKIKEFVLYK